MNGKSIEELKSEAAAAAEALRNAEFEAARAARAKAEEERREKFLAAEAARREALDVVKTDLFARLERAGVADADAKRIVSIYFKRAASYPREEKMYVEVGSFDRRIHVRPSVFPRKADGTFNYPKIIDTVTERIATRNALTNAEAQREALRTKSAALVAKIRTDFPAAQISADYSVSYPTGSGRSEYREYVAPEGKVFLRFGSLTCTEEQARIMLEAYARAFPK